MPLNLEERLFIGIYPCGIVYADRSREKDGDYVRLAFLPYKELVIEFTNDCPEAFKTLITRHAKTIQERKGQPFNTSVFGHTITLGK